MKFLIQPIKHYSISIIIVNVKVLFNKLCKYLVKLVNSQNYSLRTVQHTDGIASQNVSQSITIYYIK